DNNFNNLKRSEEGKVIGSDLRYIKIGRKKFDPSSMQSVTLFVSSFKTPKEDIEEALKALKEEKGLEAAAFVISQVLKSIHLCDDHQIDKSKRLEELAKICCSLGIVDLQKFLPDIPESEKLKELIDRMGDKRIKSSSLQ
ncbi:MAG: hypothetical protein QXL16_02010, partial [Candidatus Micrarchaeaceae archaeon]